jgi:hypothetical protein
LMGYDGLLVYVLHNRELFSKVLQNDDLKILPRCARAHA